MCYVAPSGLRGWGVICTQGVALGCPVVPLRGGRLQSKAYDYVLTTPKFSMENGMPGPRSTKTYGHRQGLVVPAPLARKANTPMMGSSQCTLKPDEPLFECASKLAHSKESIRNPGLHSFLASRAYTVIRRSPNFTSDAPINSSPPPSFAVFLRL